MVNCNRVAKYYNRLLESAKAESDVVILKGEIKKNISLQRLFYRPFACLFPVCFLGNGQLENKAATAFCFGAAFFFHYRKQYRFYTKGYAGKSVRGELFFYYLQRHLSPYERQPEKSV